MTKTKTGAALPPFALAPCRRPMPPLLLECDTCKLAMLLNKFAAAFL